MELAVVKWFGGKRRDGIENNFGFVVIDNVDIHIHKSVLNKELLETIKEDMLIWVTLNQKGKIVKAQPLHLENQEEILTALRMNISSAQQKILMKTLQLHQLDIDALEEQLTLENSKELMKQLLLAYWSKATANQCLTSIIDHSITELSLDMVQALANQPLDYNEQLAQLLEQTLKTAVIYKKSQAHAVFIKNYINLFEFFEIEDTLIEQLLEDETSAQIIAEKVANDIPTVKSGEVLRYRDFNRYKSIPIAFWFKYKILHKLIIRKKIYPYFIRSYVNTSVGTKDIQTAMNYFTKYFFGKVARTMPKNYWEDYDKQTLCYFPSLSMLSLEQQFIYWNESTNTNVEKMLDVITQIADDERGHFIERLSQTYRQHSSFFTFLPVLERVELIYKRLQNNEMLWLEQEPLVKNYLIYKITEQIIQDKKPQWLTNELISQFGENEQHPLIKVCLRLLYIGLNKQKPNVEEAVLQTIDEVILQQANARQGFDLLALLPRCNINHSLVKHCEGRHIIYRNTFPDDTAEIDEVYYCPRLRKSCEKAVCTRISDTVYMHEGSRIGPNFQLPYSYWSLQEMLTFANLEPMAETLKRPDSTDYYTNKIAGWVNRLEKLIQRMKCSTCSEPFRVDFKFSKRYDAAYNTTVFSCCQNERNENPEHDFRIYLNHCNHCKQLIDSRESKYQIYNNNGYYICYHCAGAEPNIYYNPPWDSTPNRKYEQGDICPKCNYRDKPMIVTKQKWKKCTSCNHEIKLTK
ncbi:hypothetical protein AAGS61_10550 [Lysinibacillus sp. KU-BSD001]|uniref:hypothetical protein n=1 Tax=Lysinibacillus sp. KU-BSD001 TaxID=3141328 RepID=UPI0036E1D077